MKSYLNKNVLFIHKYSTNVFSRIDDPKQLSDFIKLMMRYELRNATIMKKLLKFIVINVKCRTRTYLMNRLFNLRRRLNISYISFNKYKYIFVK